MSSLCCLFCVSMITDEVWVFYDLAPNRFSLFYEMSFHVFYSFFLGIVAFTYWFLNLIYSLINNLPLVICWKHVLTICGFSLSSKHLFINKNSSYQNSQMCPSYKDFFYLHVRSSSWSKIRKIFPLFSFKISKFCFWCSWSF